MSQLRNEPSHISKLTIWTEQQKKTLPLRPMEKLMRICTHRCQKICTCTANNTKVKNSALICCSSFYSKMKAVGVAKIFTDFWSVFDLVNIVVLFAVFAIRMLWLLAVLRVDWQGSTWAVAFTWFWLYHTSLVIRGMVMAATTVLSANSSVSRNWSLRKSLSMIFYRSDFSKQVFGLDYYRGYCVAGENKLCIAMYSRSDYTATH